MLNITERASGEETVLDLEGNVVLGSASMELRNALNRLAKTENNQVTIDFGKVKYIDSSGVGELINAAATFNNAGGNLKLKNLPPKVEQVLSLSNVLSMFEIEE
ncbi:MAG: STAS domain-containing protein [Acidobacteriota bacterium]|nr:STAS domain-containing protein [Acidobacteriota bacterium]